MHYANSNQPSAGTKVWSEWPVYRSLDALGNIHRTVNHLHNFIKNPVTSICTNHTGAYSNVVNRHFMRMCSTPEMISSYLDKHMWRECFGLMESLTLVSIKHHITEQYSVA